MRQQFIVDLIDSDETEQFIRKYGVEEITNMTNGEVIKALFPKWEQLNGNSVWLNGDVDDHTHITYTTDWWNAPYRME